MKALIIISLIFVIGNMQGQSKRFKKWIDTAAVPSNNYIEKYDHKTFFKIGEIKEEIDFQNIDQELLDACVFFVINQNRKKMNRKILSHSQALYKTASVYNRFYSASSFNGDSKDMEKVKKSVAYVALKYNYHCAQLKSTVTTCKLMDIKNMQKFFYNSKEVKNGESELGLYKGSIELKNDSTIVKEELKPMTYLQFANYVSKAYIKKQSKVMRSKAWSEASCSVMVDTRTLFTNKLPSAKIIYILGGQRTALVPQDE